MQKYSFVSIGIPVKIEDEHLSLWMQVRTEDGPLNGYLEFPGGKIEKDESPEDAVLRELEEEIGMKLTQKSIQSFKVYPHRYPDRSVLLYFFLVNPGGYELESKNWFKLPLNGDISDFIKSMDNKILEGDHQLLEDLRVYFKSLIDSGMEKHLWMS
jgi:8-oxo-dGTP diphosphatase